MRDPTPSLFDRPAEPRRIDAPETDKPAPAAPKPAEIAEARSQLGQARAADRAERVGPGWRALALEALREFAEAHEAFVLEDARLPIPAGADPRASGAIVREAKRLGWIRADGYAPTNSSNRSPKVRWRSLIAKPQPQETPTR